MKKEIQCIILKIASINFVRLNKLSTLEHPLVYQKKIFVSYDVIMILVLIELKIK